MFIAKSWNSLVMAVSNSIPSSNTLEFDDVVNVIEEHYVIFYANFVIDDQVQSRIINIFQNILFINK